MKRAFIILAILALAAPAGVFAVDTVATSRIEFSIEDNGNWRLTDLHEGITWHGEWLTPDLMRVTGSDDSCFIVSESELGMLQIDCSNLTEISIIFSYTAQ